MPPSASSATVIPVPMGKRVGTVVDSATLPPTRQPHSGPPIPPENRLVATTQNPVATNLTPKEGADSFPAAGLPPHRPPFVSTSLPWRGLRLMPQGQLGLRGYVHAGRAGSRRRG